MLRLACLLSLTAIFSSLAGEPGSPRRYLKRLDNTPAQPAPPVRSTPASPSNRTPPPQAPPPIVVVTNTSKQVEADRNKINAQRNDSIRKTIEFQKKRAEEGSASAQYDLGIRYLTGDSVEKNSVLARQWLDRAATNGSTQAKLKLKELDEAR